MGQGEHSCEHFQGRVEGMRGPWPVVQAVGDNFVLNLRPNYK